MPRLDDTPAEEGLHLPGWKRRGNQFVKPSCGGLRRRDGVRQRLRWRGQGSRPPPDIDIRWNKVSHRPEPVTRSMTARSAPSAE
jgi:hypothetical protein